MLRVASRARALLPSRASVARYPVARYASTFFTKDHEFARVDGKEAVVGITNFAQSQLGDVVYVSLPEVGTFVSKGEVMAGVESVKAASDVYSPLSGTVLEINKTITENPALVNESAEDKAWFVKLKLSNPGETKGLLSPDAYKKHCEDAANHH